MASTCCGVNNRAIASSSSVKFDECGVGSAPKAKFGFVRDIFIRQDNWVAQVLNHKQSQVDIYILTSGPRDDGASAQKV